MHLEEDEELVAGLPEQVSMLVMEEHHSLSLAQELTQCLTWRG